MAGGVAAVVAAASVLMPTAATSPAANPPDLAGGGFVVYVGELGTGRGCAVDRRLASLLEAVSTRRAARPVIADGARAKPALLMVGVAKSTP